MRLLVLAGGFGTRLKTAVTDVPKALAHIGDVPFLRLQLEQWHVQGLRKFIFLLHHQADQIKAHIQRGFVKVNNFRQGKNKFGYGYLLTPSGAREKARLTASFL
jgi:NDP-sugar pyrophosphorylase family protein